MTIAVSLAANTCSMRHLDKIRNFLRFSMEELLRTARTIRSLHGLRMAARRSATFLPVDVTDEAQ